MYILEAVSVQKHYLSKQALSGINITLGEGRITGLFGPNGSGKTTFLKIVAGLIHPSAGSVKICGEPLGYSTKARVAYLPDHSFLYDWMLIRDAENVYTRFYDDFDTKAFSSLLDFMKLTAGMRVKSLSKGMQEKLLLALTLSRRASLTVLDEPLNGVDPVARDQILGAIIKEFKPSSSILVTSHLINEFENVIDDCYFIKDGVIALSGNLDELKEQHNKSLDELYREVFAQ